MHQILHMNMFKKNYNPMFLKGLFLVFQTIIQMGDISYLFPDKTDNGEL